MAADLHGDRSVCRTERDRRGNFAARFLCKLAQPTLYNRRFERGAITPQSFQLHKENLLRMVSYCENTHECRCSFIAAAFQPIPACNGCGLPLIVCTRRALQLSYFGETTFNRAQCKGGQLGVNGMCRGVGVQAALSSSCAIACCDGLERHLRQLQGGRAARAAGFHHIRAGPARAHGGSQQVRVARESLTCMQLIPI